VPSTYSNNLRLELIASGEQGNTWGNTTNNNLGTLIEQAISGYRSIDTGWSSNACTLTALNGANDQSRNMYLDIPSSVSLSAEGQLTAPTVPKVYAIRNNTSGGYAVRIKTGASTTTCLIPNGATKVVVCDGTNFSEAVTSAADFYIANTPTTSLQATNKSYVDTADNLRLKRDGTQNMTGELVLSAGTEPSNALAAVSKTYVANTYLAKAGGTMTGAITLPSVAPSSTWQAVPKTYVDGLIPGIATTSATGVVKIGAGLSIAGDGTLTVSAPSGVSSVTATSPIVNNGTSANVNLGMIANAYYPYTGNPAGYVTSSGTVATATNATQLGGVSSTGYLRTNGSNGISNSGNDIYLSVESTSNTAPGGGAPSGAQSLRIGSHYESTLGYNAAYIGARSPSGNPAILAFYRIEGSTYTTSGTFGSGGAFTVNQLGGVGNRDIEVDSTGKFQIKASDQNLKIADGLIEKALPIVDQLQPRYFYWKDENSEKDMVNGRKLGFFAQEVQALIPENSLTGTTVDDRALIAMLVKAVQELSAEVEALKGA